MELSKHFDSKEFACHCCGKLPKDGIPPKLIEQLEILRGLVSAHKGKDTPLYVTSGYRCPKHNKAVGGESNSYHMQGKAADVHANGITPEMMVGFARKAGFKRIGQYDRQGFVHVDVGEVPSPAFWRG